MDTIEFLAHNPDIFTIIFGILSLFIGSFLNVIIYRLPLMLKQEWAEECRIYLRLKAETPLKKINLCLPFSHCPHCEHIIKPWHNIPLVSYLFLLGKCAYCRTPISLRYPSIELLTAVLSFYIAWKFGFSWQTGAAALITWIMICLVFIDIDHHILPDQLTLFLVWLGLFFSLFNLFINPPTAIIGAISGWLIFASIQWLFHLATGKIGMGMGDFKFLAALGACLGFKLLPLIILLASFLGIIGAVIAMLVKRQFKSEPLPFGPYLATAGWITLLWGNEIIALYTTITLGA